METQIARMLRGGSLLAALLIAAGIGLLALGLGQGARLVTAGLFVLMVTPVLRVVTAFVVFLRERDRPFALISLLVLAAMAAGVLLGNVHE